MNVNEWATKRIRTAALRKANQVRKRLGLRPVDHLYKGDPDQIMSCPITNTVFDDDLDREKFVVATDTERVSVYNKDEFRIGNRWYPDQKDNGLLFSVPHSNGSASFVSLFDGLLEYDEWEEDDHPLADLKA